jgi:hypothetical protein
VEDPVLWQAVVALKPTETLQRFSELESEVATARRIRLVWLPLTVMLTALGVVELLATVWR